MVAIVCPNCFKQPEVDLGDGWSNFTCVLCNKKGRVLVAKIRAKRSRTSKSDNPRKYSVRVIHSGYEDLIEFAAGYEEIEMRAGDLVVFGYNEYNRLSIINNLTLRRYTVLKKSKAPLIAAIFLGAILLAVYFLLPSGKH